MPYLYLPIEFTAREIDGYCLLAAHAAKSGVSVVIGPRYVLYDYLNTAPKGVYLLKSIRPSEVREMLPIMNTGNKIAYLDQEGLLQYDYQFENSQKYDAKTLALCDYILAVSKSHEELLRRHMPEKYHCGVRLTGNPRFDYCQRHAREFYLHGGERHLLFTTSFGNANPHHGRGTGEYLKMVAGLSNSKASLDTEVLRAELNQDMLLRYEGLLVSLTRRFPERKIVVRPHLSENIEHWRNIASGHKNVAVEPGDSIYRWLANADLHIHFNSTTSIEAAMMGVPSVTLDIPERYAQFKLGECFDVSSVYNEPDALLEDFAGNRISAKKLPHGLVPDIETHDSAQSVISCLDFPDSASEFVARLSVYRVLHRIFGLWKHKVRTWNFSNSYRDRKIGDLNEGMLYKRFSYLRDHGLMPDYDLTSFGRYCFVITPK